jgi:hypothetical protein
MDPEQAAVGVTSIPHRPIGIRVSVCLERWLRFGCPSAITTNKVRATSYEPRFGGDMKLRRTSLPRILLALLGGVIALSSANAACDDAVKGNAQSSSAGRPGKGNGACGDDPARIGKGSARPPARSQPDLKQQPATRQDGRAAAAKRKRTGNPDDSI